LQFFGGVEEGSSIDAKGRLGLLPSKGIDISGYSNAIS
jgi:hypothetical protein